MNVLFFDTETTGMIDFKADYDDPKQPRVCEISMIETDETGIIIELHDFLIKPDGWVVGEEASKINGITTEMCEADGVPIAEAMQAIHKLALRADRIVGHNPEFDRKMMIIERRRCGMFDNPEFPDWNMKEKLYCTMKHGKEMAKLPPSEAMMKQNRVDFKPPKLEELYVALFNTAFPVGNHRALADTEATMLCYFEIQRRLGGQ